METGIKLEALSVRLFAGVCVHGGNEPALKGLRMQARELTPNPAEDRVMMIWSGVNSEPLPDVTHLVQRVWVRQDSQILFLEAPVYIPLESNMVIEA